MSRCTTLRLSSRRRFRKLMDMATCYEQWAAAGYMLDRCEGNDKWKNTEQSPHYDYSLIRDRLETLRNIRKTGDAATMMFALRTSLCRNLGDMGNPKLYGHTHVGTKTLIEDYIDEVTKQLNFVCDADIPGVTVQDKLDFFTDLQRSFGRSALLLSGGGTFGLAHIGTIKALYEMQLLPKVITGSSGGSICAAVACAHTDENLIFAMNPNMMNLDVFERPAEQNNPFIKLLRLWRHGVLFDVQVFTDAMRQNLGDLTFLEAYNRTRRILNITVSSSTNYEMPRILNYLTAPNVVIWSAVAASCAVPFVYRSAPLMAKDKLGAFVPWNPSGHRWIDGSVENDLPMQRVSELFGVNHFIVAQVNPHIIPFMTSQNKAPSVVTNSALRLAYLMQTELQYRLTQLVDLGIFPSLFSRIKSIVCQRYWGDITVVPYLPWSKYPLILANPNIHMVKDYIIDGERATWPQIAIMRNHCLIELCINQNIITSRERHVSGVVQLLRASTTTPDRNGDSFSPQAALFAAHGHSNSFSNFPRPAQFELHEANDMGESQSDDGLTDGSGDFDLEARGVLNDLVDVASHILPFRFGGIPAAVDSESNSTSFSPSPRRPSQFNSHQNDSNVLPVGVRRNVY
eukprot:jgi/Hompol1/618/HPOL_005364-RA